MVKRIELTTEFIKLDSLMKLAGLADSGGQARHLIQEGLVTVNGKCETQRGKKIRPGDVVEVTTDVQNRIVVL